MKCVCSEKSPSNSGPVHSREALCHIHSRPIIRVCDSRMKKKNQRNESSCGGAVSEGANAITFCWHFSADYFSSVVSLLAFFRSLLSLLKYSVYTQWAIKIIVGYYKTNSYIYKIRSERKDEKIYRKWNYTMKCIDIFPERCSRSDKKRKSREKDIRALATECT